MVFDRCAIDIADFENSMKQKVKEHTDAFYTTLPLIRSFYDATETYEQTIGMIDTLLESNYYRLIQGDYLYMTKFFLQQYVGIEQDNEKELRELFEADSLGESVLQKFAKIPKDFE